MKDIQSGKPQITWGGNGLKNKRPWTEAKAKKKKVHQGSSWKMSSGRGWLVYGTISN